MTTSKFLSTTLRERIKGFILTVVGVILTAVYESISSGGKIPTSWEEIKTSLFVGLAGGLSYILVTFFGSNKKGIIERTLSKKDEQ